MERSRMNLTALFTLLVIPALGIFLPGCPKNNNPAAPPPPPASIDTATATGTPTNTPTVTLSNTPLPPTVTPTLSRTFTPTYTRTKTFTPTITWTPPCASTNFGFFSNVNDVTLPNNVIVAAAINLPDRVIVHAMRMVAGAGGNYVGLIYSQYNPGTGIVPGAIAGISSVYNASASGWVTTGFSAPVTLAPGGYFLAAWSDTGNIWGYTPGSSHTIGYTLGSGSWPTFWAGSAGTAYPLILADYTCFN